MAKITSYIFGIILLALGGLGYFMDPIFGVFEVDIIHSSIYVGLGAILIILSMYSSSTAAKVVGVVTALVAILGFIPPTSSVLNMVDTNIASSSLQALVAIILLSAGFAGGDESSEIHNKSEFSQKTNKQPSGQEQGPSTGQNEGNFEEGQMNEDQFK